MKNLFLKPSLHHMKLYTHCVMSFWSITVHPFRFPLILVDVTGEHKFPGLLTLSYLPQTTRIH